jgi:hypothetical protein
MVKKTNKLKQLLEDFDREYNNQSNLNRYYDFLRRPDIKKYIKQCLVEDRPIYAFGDTQSQKTQFKQELAYLVVSEGWKHVVIVSTTNMTDAMHQLQGRVEKFFGPKRVRVYSSDNLPTRFNEKEVVITMANSARYKKIKDVLEQTVQDDIKGGFEKPLEYLMIMDEGEEFDAAAGSADKSTATESELWEIFEYARSLGVDIDTVKVSATLESALLSSGYWVGTYPDLAHYQVMRLPLSVHYQGIRTGMPIDPILEEEDKDYFKGMGFTDKVSHYTDSKNIMTIVDTIESHINDCEFNTVQVANIVYGTARSQHSLMALLMTDYWSKVIGQKVQILDKGDDSRNLDNDTDIVIIIQNGDTKNGTLPEKLRDCADKVKDLKAIVVIADKMANKSITIDAGFDHGITDPTSKYFGLWCNLTFLYRPKDSNVEADIQYMRCTGVRPTGVKQHVCYTTFYLKEQIERYVDDMDAFHQQLAADGIISGTTEIPWTMNIKKQIGKGSVNKLIARTGGTKRSRGQTIDNKTRDTWINDSSTSWRAKDRIIPLSKSELVSINGNKQKVIEFAKNAGFGSNSMIEPNYIQVNHLKDTQNLSDINGGQGARGKTRNGNPDKNGNYPGWIINILDVNGSVSLYCVNNFMTPSKGDDIMYRFDMKGTGKFDFKESIAYKITKGGFYAGKTAA